MRLPREPIVLPVSARGRTFGEKIVLPVDVRVGIFGDDGIAGERLGEVFGGGDGIAGECAGEVVGEADDKGASEDMDDVVGIFVGAADEEGLCDVVVEDEFVAKSSSIMEPALKVNCASDTLPSARRRVRGGNQSRSVICQQYREKDVAGSSRSSRIFADAMSRGGLVPGATRRELRRRRHLQ